MKNSKTRALAAAAATLSAGPVSYGAGLARPRNNAKDYGMSLGTAGRRKAKLRKLGIAGQKI